MTGRYRGAPTSAHIGDHIGAPRRARGNANSDARGGGHGGMAPLAQQGATWPRGWPCGWPCAGRYGWQHAGERARPCPARRRSACWWSPQWLGCAVVGALLLAWLGAQAAYAQTAPDAPPPPGAVTANSRHAANAAAGPCHLEPGPPRAVAKVLDGETLQLDDGSEVRLIGALAPRAFDAGVADADWPAERQARASLEALLAGQTVALAQVAGKRTDRYGRQLAQVLVLRDGTWSWVQAAQVAVGQARAQALPDAPGCAAALLVHETAARAVLAGVWANPAYAVRDASRPRELLRLRNSYQLVEGVVTGVAEVRGRVYVNFGDDWRNDFTAGISTTRGERDWLDAVRGLAGARVRVRGWIERSNGPFIAVADRSQLEVLDGASSVATTAAEVAPTPRRRKRAPRAAMPAEPPTDAPSGVGEQSALPAMR